MRVRQNDRRAPIFGVRQNNRRALPDARAAKYAPAPQVRACGVFMAEKAPLLPRSLIYRKFSYSRPFLFAFLRKILYTISVNRLREPLNGMASAFEGRSRFARELINMRESPNGMASASQADSRGFDSRLSLQAKRTGTSPVLFAYAEGARNGVSADTRLSRARIRAHLAPFLHVSCFGHLRLSKLPRTRV